MGDGEFVANDKVVIHIDDNNTNFKLNNLRVVYRWQVEHCNNHSGVIGVTWNKASKKWRADINIDGKCKYLGCYDLFQDAMQARRAFERELLTNHSTN